MESVTNHINYSVFDHNVNLLHKSYNVYKLFLLLLLLLSIGKNTVTRKMMYEEIIGEDTVMGVIPGDTNIELLKETLADILPSDLSYVLEMIEGTTNRFKADFYLNCLTQAEATNFVETYCNETREVLRSATSKYVSFVFYT